MRPDVLPDGPVRVHPIYCLRSDNRADALLAVVLDETTAANFEREYAYKGDHGWVYWDDLPLQGENGPCTDASGIAEVHIVNDGFRFDPDAGIFSSGSALGVFTSLRRAEEYAARQVKDEVSVRTVPIGIPLELGF